MRHILITTLFLIVFDAIISSIIYYFMEYEGLAIAIIIIRAIGLLLIFPLSLFLVNLISKDQNIIFLITFILTYLFIGLFFHYTSPVKEKVIDTIFKLHKSKDVYVPVYLPFLLAYLIIIILNKMKIINY